VARNRKRAKERRARQRQPVATGRRDRAEREEHDDTIDPIRHAAPDVELAEAQLALGRPDLEDSDASPAEPVEAEPTEDGSSELAEDGSSELNEDQFEAEEDRADAVAAGGLEAGYDDAEPADAGGGRGRRGRRAGSDESGGGDGSAALPAHRDRAGSRLIHFLQGSWRELQRVQWPDRRQVIQATGVVIGFVIVAGVYLGVADTVASHLMNWILK
jgi:preprotein translocase SecE subunit